MAIRRPLLKVLAWQLAINNLIFTIKLDFIKNSFSDYTVFQTKDKINNMRILLVEDNISLAKNLKKGLEKNGFAVDSYNDGIEAADHIILSHQDYDLIILDLLLPGRSGGDICVSVRERGITTPIIILTASDEIAKKLVLLNSGADDYIVKPFSFEELVARIRAVIRRPEKMLSDEIVFDSLRLVSSSNQAFVDNTELNLTTKEFAILELFIRHPGQVLKREFIQDHVWDQSFNTLSNVVDVHVKNLRKKLENTAAADYLETVSGVGYRLKT